MAPQPHRQTGRQTDTHTDSMHPKLNKNKRNQRKKKTSDFFLPITTTAFYPRANQVILPHSTTHLQLGEQEKRRNNEWMGGWRTKKKRNGIKEKRTKKFWRKKEIETGKEREKWIDKKYKENKKNSMILPSS